MFSSCSQSIFGFFISFNIFIKSFSLFLNFSIIVYFFEGVKEKGIFGIFEKLTVCFDLVPKSLYLFISDSAVEVRSADNNAPEGKLNFFLKIR